MKQIHVFLKVAVCSAIIIFAAAVVADAQATRTWVSGVGDDVNPCSRTAPCKTFAGAISKTATNGEINCLDPGGFGAVTITKSITIDCEDTQGSIVASLVNGVTINITNAADTKKAVKLRGISINGVGNGLNGIRMLAGNLLVVDEVVIDGFTTHGISLETSIGTPKVVVTASAIRSNGSSGINSFITGGTMNLSVSNSTLASNGGTAFNLSNNTRAALKDSTVSSNTTGIVAFNAETSVSDCLVLNNTTGINAFTGGTVRLTGSTVTGNGTGLAITGGSIISYSSNMLDGNTTDGSPATTLVLQ